MARDLNSMLNGRFDMGKRSPLVKKVEQPNTKTPVAETPKETAQKPVEPVKAEVKEPVKAVEVVQEEVKQPEIKADSVEIEKEEVKEPVQEPVKPLFHSDVMSILRAEKAAALIRIPITPYFAELLQKMGGSVDEIDAKMIKSLIEMVDREVKGGSFEYKYTQPETYVSSPDKRLKLPNFKNNEKFKKLFAEYKATNAELFPTEHELFYDMIIKFMESKINA
ncbi:Uncharacterised protein [Vibrio cholerae]|nr:Uncharacterised protein [Vibrio cholerae]